jgi:hypothetical protein
MPPGARGPGPIRPAFDDLRCGHLRVGKEPPSSLFACTVAAQPAQTRRLARNHLFEDRAPLYRGADRRMSPATFPSRPLSVGCRRSGNRTRVASGKRKMQRWSRRSVCHIIPGILNIDPCPGALGDGIDTLPIADEEVPRILAGGDDGLIAVPDERTELVAAEIVPDVLHRVEFR